MTIIKISIIGMVTAFCVLILRDNKSDIGILLGIVGGIVIIISLIEYVAGIFSVMNNIVKKSGVDSELLTTVFKILGIGFITEFSSDIVDETGNKFLAKKIILAGKITIFYISMPVITSIFDTILRFIS